jgi:hypothetical protein
MKRQNRFDYYKPLTITMFIVGVGLILASLILLSRIGFNDKSDEIKKKEGHVHTPPSPENPTVETAATENADAEAKQKGNTVSTSTSVFFDHPHPDVPHQDNGQLGNNQSDQDESEPDEEVVILDEKDYLDEDGKITDWENWCLARMHKNGWFKPEDIPIIYEDPNGVLDGVYIWTKFKDGGHLKFEDAPEHVKARSKALKEKLDYATESGEGREVIRITRELSALHRPYRRPAVNMQMHLGNLPFSWRPYFNKVFDNEIQARQPEFKRHIHQ